MREQTSQSHSQIDHLPRPPTLCFTLPASFSFVNFSLAFPPLCTDLLWPLPAELDPSPLLWGKSPSLKTFLILPSLFLAYMFPCCSAASWKPELWLSCLLTVLSPELGTGSGSQQVLSDTLNEHTHKHVDSTLLYLGHLPCVPPSPELNWSWEGRAEQTFTANGNRGLETGASGLSLDSDSWRDLGLINSSTHCPPNQKLPSPIPFYLKQAYRHASSYR